MAARNFYACSRRVPATPFDWIMFQMLLGAHSYTAALLRLIIGRIFFCFCFFGADERETNSNAGSARARLFFDLFDLIYLFVCFVCFSQNFSPVVKRDKVTRREKTVCLSRLGKFEQSASERERMAHLERWRTLVSSFCPIHAAPINMQTRGIGRLLFFFLSFPSFLLIAFVSPVSIVGSRAASFACQIKANPLQSIQLLSGDDESNRLVWFLWAIL